MKYKHNHSADVVFALVLFGVFATTVLLVLMSGALAYKGIANVLVAQFEERVCVNYIAAKVRHFDTAGAVSTGKFAGCDALFFDEEYDGCLYRTAIYYFDEDGDGDGKIMEVFYEDGTELPASAGEEIINAKSLTFENVREDLLRVRCTGKNGHTDTLLVGLRSEKEEAA